MLRQTVLFDGIDVSGYSGLWVTNGTAAGTYEFSGISGVYSSGLPPYGLFAGITPDFTVFNGKVLFEGADASGDYGLWLTDGAAAGTSELTGIGGVFSGGLGPYDFTVFNDEVLFNGVNVSGHSGLWVTNGTAAGTSELTGIGGAFSGGLRPYDLAVFNDEVLFNGVDVSGHLGLWVSDGTAIGTNELRGISSAYSGGIFNNLQTPDFTVYNNEVLFEGRDTSNLASLWVTNGISVGTHELTGISGTYSGGLFAGTTPDFTVFNGEVLFSGNNMGPNPNLWVTNGTAAGTSELANISGAYKYGLFFGGTPDFTVFNSEVMFEGEDTSTNLTLWVTNGTAAGTSELADIAGLIQPLPGMTVFNGKVLFNGIDTAGTEGLWVSNGTIGGTRELIRSINPQGLTPATLSIPPPDDFLGNNTSDILFRNNSTGDTWFEAISNGKASALNPWQEIGGSDTHYAVLGVGDFYGTGVADILFRNNATGDTWFEAISNGAFAGWHQIGGSDTSYAVVGTGDFSGYGTSDILFRNTATGDTWFEATSNGKFAGWNQIGGSDTHYSVVGIGDFFESGVDDILFRNNSMGDTWAEAITDGASAGWDQIGGSDTHYSVVGVGDFFGNGSDDILFRNNSTGDTWFEAISNGAFAGWTPIGGSDTTYSVVGIGDYFGGDYLGSNTSDILFRNTSTGDTWFEAMSYGTPAGWNHIGGSNTSYSVPITVGPPALT